MLSPEPDPTGKMTSAKGYYDSMYGRIESRWEVAESKLDYHFTVSANYENEIFCNGKPVN